MNVAAVIAEYNPFHNGHAWQIEQIRHRLNADYLVIVMSGDFVQRGEPAIADKYLRTDMALHCGADLVLEMPVLFSTASAEYFATAGVSILQQLGCVDVLCFGTEQGNLEDFYPAAAVLEQEPEAYRRSLSSYLKEGYRFPAARTSALSDYLQTDMAFLGLPNNILAMEYLRASRKLHSSIQLFSIQRTGAGYHETELHPSLSSASAIRSLLCRPHVSKDWKEALTSNIPESALPVFLAHLNTCGPVCIQDFFPALQYILLRIQSPEELTLFFDIDPFLANRIFQKRFTGQNYAALLDTLLSKNQTQLHIQRSLLHLLLQIPQPSEPEMLLPQYTRILGMKRSSSALLREIKGHAQIPIISKMADADTCIYASAKTDAEKAAALLQLKQTSFASHLYESVVSQKTAQPLRHEKTRRIVIH